MTKDEMRLWSEAFGCSVLAQGANQPAEYVASYATQIANRALRAVRQRSTEDVPRHARDVELGEEELPALQEG